MSLLDTVEHVVWKRTRISNGEVEYFTERDWKHENLFEWEPQYSRETVESLLSQCRKEALLGAAEVCEAKAAAHGWNYDLPSIGRELGAEFRRMAESTMEGEK